MGVFSHFGDTMINTLSVVNEMLGTLGEAPINDIDASHPMVPRAVGVLATTNFQIQSDKWWFNTETVTLQPQVGTQEIILPADCLSVDACQRTPAVAMRDGKLYNLDDSTYAFPANVIVVIKRLIPFDQTPVTARAYIGARAVQKFQATMDGDALKMRSLSDDVKLAYITFNSEHIRNVQVNFLARSSASNILYSMRGRRVNNFRRY
jgi:hypothetical protein